MKFIKCAISAAKTMPKKVWIISLVIPGGLTILGSYVITKSIFKSFILKTKN